MGGTGLNYRTPTTIKRRNIMNFRKKASLNRLLMIVIAICAFAGASFAQISVNITGPGYTVTTAPSGSFTVTATVTGNSIAKVVFYRNDVPYLTDTSYPYQLSQNQLGQDTYTYRARAYNTAGDLADSAEFKLTVETPYVLKMGVGLLQTPPPNAPPVPSTDGPDRFVDHTSQIRAAVKYISEELGGGTLFFPCPQPFLPTTHYPPNIRDVAIYNISNTIYIPSNVTLQGESAEESVGRCRIYWNNDIIKGDRGCREAGSPLQDKAMFNVEGDKARVRFKDLWLFSRTRGRDCPNFGTASQIYGDNTTAVLMDAQTYGNISDVIFENVSITAFTYGISAVGNSISEIKMRGIRPFANFRQLSINATYAYDWDVQNFNISGMLSAENQAERQGAVEIKNAGAPATYTGENKKLKFLQLNCNGNFENEYPPFCVKVEKHGGLYFRQLHHEGVDSAIKVMDISSGSNPRSNPDPIVLESSVATGEFRDPSMKLYLIGSGITAAPEIASPGLDEGRLRFFDAGVNSTLVDCGDVHWDLTPVYPTPTPTPEPTPQYEDLKMLFTHSERNRASFFAQSGGVSFIKPHTYCPSGVSGSPNINEIGGEYFDNGVLPTEAGTYSNVLNASNCQSHSGNYADCLEDLLDDGGSVYIDGSFTVNRTVNIPSGSQILGSSGSALVLSHNVNDAIVPLLQIDIPVGTNALPRVSNIVIRNLALKTNRNDTIGIALVNKELYSVGVSSDIHFSGVSFQGFGTGIYAGRIQNGGEADPMIDGVSLKHLSFFSNDTGVEIFSSNASNWNIMDLNIESDSFEAEGWYQTNGGYQGFQRVSCQGTKTNNMKDCLRLGMTSGTYLTDLKPTQYVTNALTIGENGTVHTGIYEGYVFTTLLVRDSDFTSTTEEEGRMNVLGKAFITSMNNKYSYFNVESTYKGNESRLTYCGDTYTGGSPYPGLDNRHQNLWVGVPTLTRVQCGTRPMPWDDAIRWGGEGKDQPLVGNFYDDVREDFVIYRGGAQSQFLIKQAGGTGSSTINWGTDDDVPMIGRFYPNTRSQVVIWRPSKGQWWVNDPNTSATYVWSWGISEDIPFVGNFLDESGSVPGNKDEIAVYRPSTKTFWILNPRSGTYTSLVRTANYGTNIQVGDFLGVGYDQIAQYTTGVWNIINPRTGSTYTASLGQSGDVPVAGKYLPQLSGKDACTQIGVWRPSTQEFLVADPFSNCGTRSTSVIWGSNNDFNAQPYDDDIPLTINTADGTLRRPTAYRPTKGAFPYSIANGQWWVRDPIP